MGLINILIEGERIRGFGWLVKTFWGWMWGRLLSDLSGGG
jgi:hypothetical protein